MKIAYSLKFQVKQLMYFTLHYTSNIFIRLFAVSLAKKMSPKVYNLDTKSNRISNFYQVLTLIAYTA